MATKAKSYKLKVKPAKVAAKPAIVHLKVTAAALKRPGLPKAAVFGPSSGRKGNVYAYSVDPSNPKLIVRKSSTGEKTVGRLVADKFVASKSRLVGSA